MKKMNLLWNGLPNFVDVGGVPYEINTDFRVSVAFELLMQDSKIAPEDKADKAISLYYPRAPHDIQAAGDALINFYRCNRESLQDDGGKGNYKQPYSFQYDDQYIYSAFWQQYGIDLERANMHWWKFRSLFNGLTSDTLFVKIMGWRSAEIDSKAPASERNRLLKLKQLYALPKSTAQDKEAEKIKQILMGNGNLQDLIKPK